MMDMNKSRRLLANKLNRAVLLFTTAGCDGAVRACLPLA